MPQLDTKLWAWINIVSSKLENLTKTQARVLALYSFGMVITQSCGITTISLFLGLLLERQNNSVRQQLREFTYEGTDKRGENRQTVGVEGCFIRLLIWVLTWWTGDELRLVFALDATTFKQIFTVLVVSVMYRGCAIPVAWHVLPQTKAEQWRPHWERLLSLLKPAIADDWMVIVLADRGLYAKWLYQHIVKLGWHPFLRINQQGSFRPKAAHDFRPLRDLVNEDRPDWSGSVTCFKTDYARLDCTLLAHFDPAYRDPWLILTDLPASVADAAWYGMRSWIEAGFKDFKRGGWQWQQTRMTDPDRASRLWLVMAVATIWVLSVGGYAEADLPASSLPCLPAFTAFRGRPHTTSRPRLTSIFAGGLLIILAALLRGQRIPFGEFIPEPWPSFSSKARLC